MKLRSEQQSSEYQRRLAEYDLKLVRIEQSRAKVDERAKEPSDRDAAAHRREPKRRDSLTRPAPASPPSPRQRRDEELAMKMRGERERKPQPQQPNDADIDEVCLSSNFLLVYEIYIKIRSE